jgi:hypothetical protein
LALLRLQAADNSLALLRLQAADNLAARGFCASCRPHVVAPNSSAAKSRMTAPQPDE